jgi:hypothetical protein
MGCDNCKYLKRQIYGLRMDGTVDTIGSCMFLVNGIKIRGAKKETDTCADFEETPTKE